MVARPVTPRDVEVVFVPVAFVQVMLVTFKVDPVGMVRLPVTVRFVVVAFVAVKFDVFRFVKLPVAAVRVLETKRFVPVPDRNVKFWRVVRPETARDAILAVPVTVRFVRASFTPVAFRYTTSTRFVLPVAVRFEVTRPPKRVTVVVADAPRWVTEARVSVSVVTEAGQLTPFERHIP